MAGVWTNNWRAIRNTMLLGGIYPGLNTIVYSNGSSAPLANGETLTGNSVMRGLNTNYFRVGTGTLAPAATDYTVTEASNISYLSVGTEAPIYDIPNGTMTRTSTLTVQNNSGNNITLTEWGLYTYQNRSSSRILVYREVFDTPIILQGYQAAALELTLTLTLANPQ